MHPERLTRPLRVVRACLHLLMAALLVLVALRGALTDADHAWATSSAAVGMGAVYAAGPALPRIGRSHRAAAAWLAVLGAAWIALLVLSQDGVWIAFPLFFLQLHLLPLRAGVGAVAATTLAAIAGFAWHTGGFTPAAAIGPVIGAAVAVVTVLAYQALHAESEHRRRLLDELDTARSDLAEAERTAGVLAERERLAREIHDTLAQGLSSIQLLLRAAERALPTDAGTATGHVQQARQTAQDNLAEARRFVRDLSPPDLDEGSLPAALRRLCSTTGERAGLAVHFHLSGAPAEVARPVEVALLRIAQSALANTAAHAQATRAEVTLSYMDDGVTLDVLDDGTGFTPGPAGADTEESGFGLAAMRARAASLGGTLAVESEPGRGTVLAASFPLQQSTAESP
ncbi:sensor histidine kinase [Salinifilum ghardaiensis]